MLIACTVVSAEPDDDLNEMILTERRMVSVGRVAQPRVYRRALSSHPPGFGC